ncbi:MAG TPA: metallopeptidase (SprT family) [Gammaproteobacteria bacterium]|nr:metallopeptidase (SprT family) [Gammaproteobacteria bacterium]
MRVKRYIQPITPDQRRVVCETTSRYLELAGELFHIELAPILVEFDLEGRSAGMYRNRYGRRTIRYNAYLFAKYFADNLATTVPHEVAHYAADVLYGAHRIKPHGVEWQGIMRALGAEPRATGRYDLEGVPVRRQRRFGYRCRCGTHWLSATRHNRVLRRNGSYLCRRCGAELVHQEEAVSPTSAQE